MINVARLPESDRRELFRNTADKMGLNDTISLAYGRLGVRT